jgi:hypothetical protein
MASRQGDPYATDPSWDPIDVKVWQWRIVVRKSRLPFATKAVLHALGTFMDADGCAYPSQETIAAAASSSRRTVGTHLEAAASCGWIRTEQRLQPGQRWRLTHYQASVPARFEDLIPALPGQD